MIGGPTVSKSHGQFDASTKSIELFMREMQPPFYQSLPKLLITISDEEAA